MKWETDWKLDTETFTNKGGREYNEDFADSRIGEKSAFFVVADGLGGHRGGDLASRCVVETLTTAWEEDTAGNVRKDWLEKQILMANSALLNLQRASAAAMKSTVAVLWLDGHTAAWAHVGDSRIYHLSGGRIRLLTDDHSVTFKKFKAGEITKNAMHDDEDRARLLRAVGDENCLPDCAALSETHPVRPGDAFLLCTDGFWEHMCDEEILVDYLKSESATQWGQLMMLRVMRRLHPDSDNLTFTVIVAADIQSPWEQRSLLLK